MKPLRAKLEYTKPSMKVYEMKHQCHILAGSNDQAGLQDYNVIGYEEE